MTAQDQLKTLAKHPINISAAKALKEAGQPIDASEQAIYQLMEWGLDQGLNGNVPWDGDLRFTVEQLSASQKQMNAFKLLTPDGSDDLTQKIYQVEDDPDRAANLLLETLIGYIKEME